ncbi:thyroglobulin [Protopterus annectens]|uniref:thyroglobulin n=1 Tax=Protopterus annectens TaxID=7888 RepID=UPI001CFA4476|nr:thyroglobulin [Protopterus annectens]
MHLQGLLLILLYVRNIADAQISEYQLDSQPLTPCELKREDAARTGQNYIPQCSEDGKYRTLQCSRNGSSCWCVDANGNEVPTSKQNNSVIPCLSFCQLQRQQLLVSGYVNSTSTSYIPQCTDSGDYETVQCETVQGQCWCVDSDGMEIYGTRQAGKPTSCPGSCEVRDRSTLHGFGTRSPPRCSKEGEFMPVQCKFVNTTDMMVLNVVDNFNRFPDAFQTFSSFRKIFPEVSGYCYCTDSLGRELAETGLELILDEVYDTAFAGLESGFSFTESILYRILSRRFLAIQLLITGRFRCPTKCEQERFAANQYRNVFKPTCDENGNYKPVQCQLGGQCWCVDASGKEIFGTRIKEGLPDCGKDKNCAVERKQALSRLFHGPVGPFNQENLFFTSNAGTADFLNRCSTVFKELFVNSGLLISLTEDSSMVPVLEEILGEAVEGLFPSKHLSLTALQFTTNAKRFQENLFGGKFLKNIGNFNFTGAIGSRGTFNFSRFFQQIGLTGMYSGGNFVELAKLFSSEDDSYLSKGISGFSRDSFNLNQTIKAIFGKDINLHNNQRVVKSVSSLLENNQFLFTLHEIISHYGTDDFSEIGDIVTVILQSGGCSEALTPFFIPKCTEDGDYAEIQCAASECWCVDKRGKEIIRSRVQHRQPRCPSKCEKEREKSQSMKASLPAGSGMFIPSCLPDGNFRPVQCVGKSCFCMDLEGQEIPGTRKAAGEIMMCPSDCQLRAAQTFMTALQMLLSDPSSISQVSDVYIPQCATDGTWKPVQCDGPTEQAFEWYERWVKVNNGGMQLPLSEILTELWKHRIPPLKTFKEFVEELFIAQHQNIFPVFTNYPSFEAVPPEVLESSETAELQRNILLNPYVFWQLLAGNISHYPGSYSDFSVPLGHFEVRHCWCTDSNGDEVLGTKTDLNKIPNCIGVCDRVKHEVLQFIEEANEIIKTTNSSFLPFGYGFLMANGIQFTNRELFISLESFQSETDFLEKLLSGTDYAIRLAAQSTLQFYQRNRTELTDLTDVVALGYSPYIPQCDGLGRWETTQCYESTGHCWCVTEYGSYIQNSLVTRSQQLPKCHTSCQRSAANAVIGQWKQSGSVMQTTPSNLFIPSCSQLGEYMVLQMSEMGTWCVNPYTGEVIQSADQDINGSFTCPSWCEILRNKTSLNEVGTGYIPECRPDDGSFLPVQCDQEQEACWCVFENGEMVPTTWVNITKGKKPSCAKPQCTLPFDAQEIPDGAVICEDVIENGEHFQQCQLVCRQGYHNAFADSMYKCDTKTNLWISEPPHPLACQKLQSFQTIKSQLTFTLLLPAGKTCTSEYSGLLNAFQTFILDDMTAHGFCHLQINSVKNAVSVPVCTDSTVSVGCLTVNHLGVNITWQAQLEDIPSTFLPDLHDIENAFISDKLILRFVNQIRSGSYQLNLDGKTFPADTSVAFIHDEEFVISPLVWLGCYEGFRKVSVFQKSLDNIRGCSVCPPGSYFQKNECVKCKRGSYQDASGRRSCHRCPLGKNTVSTGAFSSTQCATDCQLNNKGLKCDEEGQYLPAQYNATSQKSFCVSMDGEKVNWTETTDSLSDSQCLLLRKFEIVTQSQFTVNAEGVDIHKSIKVNSTHEAKFLQCISECSNEEACSFLTVSGADPEVQCDLYSNAEVNFQCSNVTEETQGYLQNPAALLFQHLSCLLKVKNGNMALQAVYRKKGYAFDTVAQKTFLRTSFQNALQGVYKTMVFPVTGTTLTDVHQFCHQTCGKESCCDGFVLSQNILSGGTILCGLMSHPDALLCNDNDWNTTSQIGGDGVCKGVKSDKEKKQFSFTLGGQQFTGSYSLLSESAKAVEYSAELSSEFKENIQRSFITFQRVHLWKDSDMDIRVKSSSECFQSARQDQGSLISDSAREEFFSVDRSNIEIDHNVSLPSLRYWLFKHEYSNHQAQLWCQTRCEEEEFCNVVDLQDRGNLHFVCILYPDTQQCGTSNMSLPQKCGLILPEQPEMVYKKRVALEGKVKNFYNRLPFQKLNGVVVRSVINMTGKDVSDGYFQCERHCDEDSCCKGFEFLKNSKSSDEQVLCLTLSSLGVETCNEDPTSRWHVLDCTTGDSDSKMYPFGWYQKPVNQWNPNPSMCPAVHLPPLPKKVSLDNWTPIDMSSTMVDSSLSQFDIVHISADMGQDFNSSRDWCLAACSSHRTCTVVTVELQHAATRCMFYPDTQSCRSSLEGQRCQLLIKEPATHIYRLQAVVKSCLDRCGNYQPGEACQCNVKCADYADCCPDFHICIDPSLSHTQPHLTSVYIPTHGTLLGLTRAVRVGSDWKDIKQFLGVPYANSPAGMKRFTEPQQVNWTGLWNATFSRPSCLQPGDGKAQYSTVGEDCLYLNIYIPKNIGGNLSSLVFFHNSAGDYRNKEQNLIDGSYLAAVGNIIVAIANYRVGVFGFLSTGSDVASGNWGLLDQAAALKWVEKNIASFGGDNQDVTVAADGSGADVTSLHLLVPTSVDLFKRVILMGGSIFSPVAVKSKIAAMKQAVVLAEELGCSSSSEADLISCLRDVPALTLNTAQTKLLAVSGPFQSWGPVVDDVSIQRTLKSALQKLKFSKVDLLLGSTAQDGLVSRAKAIKKFEESQGRNDSKLAFYQALQNSFGGESSNILVKDAVTWFYSLQHSESEYSRFSRALENATRDHFIICPVVKMAAHWAESSNANTFMYHVPDSISQNSLDLSLPFDVQSVFGLPLHPQTEELFSEEEKTISLNIMQYLSNFIKSGNPNYPLTYSRTSLGESLPPWPRFLPHSGGDNYKEFSAGFPNYKGLKAGVCSFWSDYIPALQISASKLSSQMMPEEGEDGTADISSSELSSVLSTVQNQTKNMNVNMKDDKETYN